MDLDGNAPKKKKNGNTEIILPNNESEYGVPTVTFCVTTPNPGSRKVLGEGWDVGHTYIRVDDGGGNVSSFGFYPDVPLSIGEITSAKNVKGKINDDSKASYHTSIKYEITKEQADALVEYAKQYDQNNQYNMVTNNCTTFAVKALAEIGIDVPTKEHKWKVPFWAKFYDFFGYSPADAAMDINEHLEACLE